MQKRAVNPPGATIPGISQGVVVEASRLMFLSGHVPFTPEGHVVRLDLEAQLTCVFENLQMTLQSAGASLKDLVRITLYVRGYKPDQLETIRAVRDRFVDRANPPASALVGVAALFHADVLVEVDGIAVMPVNVNE